MSTEIWKYLKAQRTGFSSMEEAENTFRAEADAIIKLLGDNIPKTLLSIGCGIGGIEKFLIRAWGCRATLLDKNDWNPQYGFSTSNRFYNDFNVTKKYLESVLEYCTFVTPEELNGNFDLACSFLSCGFHYPLDTYQNVFETTPWIADIRGELPTWLTRPYKIMAENTKYRRIYMP